MGIDAEMFVRYKGAKPTEDQLRLWSWDLCRAVGAQNFFIDRDKGRAALSLSTAYEENVTPGKRWDQDGDSIVAEANEWFIAVSFWTCYYGVGYERGNWQIIVHTAEWLEQNVGGEVWYGGDSGGVRATPFGIVKRNALVAHALSQHGRDYFFNAFEREPFKVPPPCSLCVKSRGMTRHGWGHNYTAVSCGGCGKSFESRDDGKTWTTKEE